MYQSTEDTTPGRGERSSRSQGGGDKSTNTGSSNGRNPGTLEHSDLRTECDFLNTDSAKWNNHATSH